MRFIFPTNVRHAEPIPLIYVKEFFFIKNGVKRLDAIWMKGKDKEERALVRETTAGDKRKVELARRSQTAFLIQ